MLTMTEPEDMEVDYDHPASNMYTNSYQSPFQSSQGIFSKDRLKTGFDNNVADLFGKIHLNEEKKEQRKEEEENKVKSTNSIVPYSSPSSPPLSHPEIFSNSSSPAIIQSSYQQQSNDDASSQQVDITHSIPPIQEDKPYIVLHHSHDYLNHSHGKIHFISGLVKITFTTCIALLVLYLAAYFVKSLKHDVGNKIAGYETDSMQEMAYCHQQYEENECDPSTRLDALKEHCRDWEICMYKPVTVSHTKAMAETVGEIANGFVETITLRTLFAGIAMTWTFLYFWPSQT
ncbi:hypothetical protein K501DRAFT_26557 [Backusella circina FSU 941]|nr:hypothetical protein K501DRAFT_26557 [Backusella circina FSU 941]